MIPELVGRQRNLFQGNEKEIFSFRGVYFSLQEFLNVWENNIINYEGQKTKWRGKDEKIKVKRENAGKKDEEKSTICIHVIYPWYNIIYPLPMFSSELENQNWLGKDNVNQIQINHSSQGCQMA